MQITRDMKGQSEKPETVTPVASDALLSALPRHLRSLIEVDQSAHDYVQACEEFHETGSYEAEFKKVDSLTRLVNSAVEYVANLPDNDQEHPVSKL